MNNAYIVAGLAYGDEGKGATVDFLCRHRDVKTVVRYNGGSQAGHNVVLPDGRHHTFSQFGSGTFVPGVKTHLSRFMLVNPQNMMREEKHLREVGITDAFDRLTVDRRCLIITPFHQMVNRQSSGTKNITCGEGVGECRGMNIAFGQASLFAGDLQDEIITKHKLRFIQRLYGETLYAPYKEDYYINEIWKEYREWPAKITDMQHFKNLMFGDNVVYEGAQGVLLDETHGEQGYNTWTDCTFNNAVQLLDESGFDGARHKIGVVRTYYTRHGAGPFATEDLKIKFPEPHNNDTGFQGKFRQGKFDKQAFEYALKVCKGVDYLAVNHIDCVAEVPPGKILIAGYGPTHEDRDFIR